jgi:DNA-binding transcriptional MerR regulator
MQRRLQIPFQKLAQPAVPVRLSAGKYYEHYLTLSNYPLTIISAWNPPMTLQELSEAVGVSARTIRFYIARGLLAGPLKAGRGADYGQEHMERLERIKRLQAEGKTLIEISRRLEPSPREVNLDAPAAWWQYAIETDVMVSVRADASPWRMRRIRTALEALARALKEDRDAADERNLE